MSVKLINKNFDNVFNNPLNTRPTNKQNFDKIDYCKYERQFNLLRGKKQISDESELIGLFQLLVLLSFYTRHGDAIYLTDPSIAKKCLENRLNWYIDDSKFHLNDIEYSCLNIALIYNRIKIDGGTIDYSTYTGFHLNGLDVGSRTLPTSNENDGDSSKDFSGPFILNYTYDGILKHTLIVCFNPDKYCSIPFPYFMNIDDGRYQKFKECVAQTIEKNPGLKMFEMTFTNYSEDLF